MHRTVEGYHKNAKKCCFWIWLRPRYKIPEFFTIAPVLASTLTVCRRNRSDPSSLYRIRYVRTLQVLLLLGYVTSITKSRFGLAWSRLRADRGPNRPTSVFRTTIGVCKIVSRSVEIWQYEAKKLFLSKKKQSTAKPMLRFGRQ